MAGSGFHRFYTSQLCAASAATGATAGATAAAGTAATAAAVAATAVVANATGKAAGTTAGGRRALAAADSEFSGCKGVVLDIGAFIGTQALVGVGRRDWVRQGLRGDEVQGADFSEWLSRGGATWPSGLGGREGGCVLSVCRLAVQSSVYVTTNLPPSVPTDGCRPT